MQTRILLTSWKAPGAILGRYVESPASRKPDCNQNPETSAELRGRYNIIDALTLYQRFLLAPFHLTPSISPPTKPSVRSLRRTMVPKKKELDDARPGRANLSVLQMRGSLEDAARPHSGNGSVLQMRWGKHPHSVSSVMHMKRSRGMMCHGASERSIGSAE